MYQLDPVSIGILWNRLIVIVDEASINLVRSSFSTAVREANDFACVLMDRDGDAVAQANVSVPSFIGTLPSYVKHVLTVHRAASLRPGDVFMCNDPWICNGHLPDVNLAMPIFHRGRLVGFAGAGAHWPDIGGNQYSSESRSVFEEGLRIPLCKVMEQGVENELVLDFIRNNVGIPDVVLGDFRAQVAALRSLADGLCALLDEHDGLDFAELAGVVKRLTEQELRGAIEAMPDGSYFGEVQTDGFDDPICIATTVTVRGSDITVDFAGTSPQSERGINSVLNFTTAYAVYTLKCLLTPTTPNNQGSLAPIRIEAPLGCVLNPRFPAAVNGRTMTGHFIHAPIMKALAMVLRNRVIAESGGCPIWGATWAGTHRGRRFSNLNSANGGLGASSHADGALCTPFPSNVPNTPIEVTEAAVPLLIERKELRMDSGGDGEFRGGMGQTVAIRMLADGPASASLRCDRTMHAAEGLFGGRPGALGTIELNGVPVVQPKQRVQLRQNDVLQIATPGGGGVGDPSRRSREQVRRDLENGYISLNKAQQLYGWK